MKEKNCHAELVSASPLGTVEAYSNGQETLKQVQGDSFLVQGDSFLVQGDSFLVQGDKVDIQGDRINNE